MKRGWRGVSLRVVLAALCAYHLGIGLVSWASADATMRFAGWFYGLSFEGDAGAEARFVYMLKALGMYALFTSALLGCALWDPRRFRPVILAVVGLLVLRSATRLIFFETLSAGLGVSWERNLFNVVLMLAQAGALLVCLPPREPGEAGA